MIPKIIHFCWMSQDPYPKLISECISSWKKVMPDYKIMKWDSSNFDFQKYPYAREAMESQKYAFVSDIVRLHVLYEYGGIYLDSDIKVFKDFSPLLDNKAFTGFESSDRVGVWLLASEKRNPLFKEMLECYKDKHFVDEVGQLDLTPNPVILKPVFDKHGLKYNNQKQNLDYITVYPKDYFCPLDGETGTLNITDNSYAIHLFNGAWRDEKIKQFSDAYKQYYRRVPNFLGHFVKDKIAKVGAAIRVGGLPMLLDKLCSYISKNIKG